MKERKGFTLIELLAVIVILGILTLGAIKGISVLIEKSRNDQKLQQEKTLKMAAESYLQANKSQMPKEIGESRIVYASELKLSNYLKEELKNSKGESCMSNSRVKVYRASKNKYEYTVNLYCGTDVVPTEEKAEEPVIETLFTDSTGEPIGDVYMNVSDAYLRITITGSADGTEIVDGYSYVIYAQKQGKNADEDALNEVYNSGTLSGNGETKVNVPIIALKDYIDITSNTNFKVRITAYNKSGGRQEKVLEKGEKPTDEASYNDDKPPICKTIEEAATGADDWIKKGDNKTRTIAATCDDGKGSGCIRDVFRQTWPNENQQDAEWGYIQVKDNAGNLSIENGMIDLLKRTHNTCDLTNEDREAFVKDGNCRVRVNVDLTAASATIKAYVAETKLKKGKDDTKSIFAIGNNKATSAVANNDKQTVTINASEYQNLKGSSTWMNNDNYKNGVVYEVVATDNIHLDKWTWETNPALISDYNLKGLYDTYSLKNEDATSGSFKKLDMNVNDCGQRNETITFGFYEEGMRRGRLTIYDKAGNETTFYIAANLDRTAPPVPEPTILEKIDGRPYDHTKDPFWSKVYVNARIPDSSKLDNLSGGKKRITLSGFRDFQYLLIRPKGEKMTGTAQKKLFDKDLQGKNKISFRACDKADNCTKDYNEVQEVWIDTIAPQCIVTMDDIRTINPNGNGWLKKGQSTTVRAACKEDANNISSGCIAPLEFSKKYDQDIVTGTAGAVGNNQGGKVSDKAGNITNCPANKTVKIDTNPPSCTASGDNAKWTNKAVTLKWGCRDDKRGGVASGCYTANKSKPYSGKHTYGVIAYAAYWIYDNAKNAVQCRHDGKPGSETINRKVYYDGQAPTCVSHANRYTKDNSHPKGITISYKCTDPGNPHSGVKKCPEKQTHVTDTQQITIRDNVGNTATCKATVHHWTQYRYILKKCHYGCDTCYRNICVYSGSTYGCSGYPARRSNPGGCSLIRGNCRIGGCYAIMSCSYSCGCSSCYTKRCDGGWSDWGHGSTGCSSDSRYMYYGNQSQ